VRLQQSTTQTELQNRFQQIHPPPHFHSNFPVLRGSEILLQNSDAQVEMEKSKKFASSARKIPLLLPGRMFEKEKVGY
jgi:hypothetical protein